MTSKWKAGSPTNENFEEQPDQSHEPHQFTLQGQPATALEGQLIDFISGQPVSDTPEEREAVQVLARRLVQDLGYPPGHIRTRPQFRVKESPSGRERWPVDIAVFRSPNQLYENVYIIAECKRKTRKDGRRQLEIYLNLCPAQIGVWYNGKEHLYLRKVSRPDGTFSPEEFHALPRFGQTLDQIGRIRRKELVKPTNLKATFRDIRNHLAGMTTGITRDGALAREITNLLFVKIYDEVNTPPNGYVRFVVNEHENAGDVRQNMIDLFESGVKTDYDDVFDQSDQITLDANSIVYIVGELQNYVLTEADREAIGEAFEVFIGPALRGSEGQFFTPRNVVRMMIEVIDPDPREVILDPACGSGGFLIAALEKVWSKVDLEGQRQGWSVERTTNTKRDIATKYFRGIDKDSFLSKVTKAYMAIVGDGRGGVFCENSLEVPIQWKSQSQDKIRLGSCDIIVTNPPFGSKIKVKGSSILGPI